MQAASCRQRVQGSTHSWLAGAPLAPRPAQGHPHVPVERPRGNVQVVARPLDAALADGCHHWLGAARVDADHDGLHPRAVLSATSTAGSCNAACNPTLAACLRSPVAAAAAAAASAFDANGLTCGGMCMGVLKVIRRPTPSSVWKDCKRASGSSRMIPSRCARAASCSPRNVEPHCCRAAPAAARSCGRMCLRFCWLNRRSTSGACKPNLLPHIR